MAVAIVAIRVTPPLLVAQIPLLRFVVYLLDIKSYSKLYNIFTCWDAVDSLWAFDFLQTCAVQLVVNLL